MRDLSPIVEATKASEALLEAVAPFLDGAARTLAHTLPAQAAMLRSVVLVQLHPTMARLVLVGLKAGPVEAARLTEPELPNAGAIAEAAEAFIAGGLSAMPDATVEGVFQTAAPFGAGFMVLLDPMTGSARCVVLSEGKGLEHGVELFEIAPARATVH